MSQNEVVSTTPVTLGVKVKDKISGFAGVVTARIDYLAASPRALVTTNTPEKFGGTLEEWFDLSRLEVQPESAD